MKLDKQDKFGFITILIILSFIVIGIIGYYEYPDKQKIPTLDFGCKCEKMELPK